VRGHDFEPLNEDHSWRGGKKHPKNVQEELF